MQFGATHIKFSQRKKNVFIKNLTIGRLLSTLESNLIKQRLSLDGKVITIDIGSWNNL